ncbi:MAG: PilZ domain-containing protein [Spirochaetota bacterium]
MKIRKKKRVHLTHYLRVFNASGGAPVGQLVDITPEGLMLISDTPVDIGLTMTMRMSLPENAMNSRMIVFGTQSKWCRKDGGGKYYSMGFTITDITPKEMLIMQELTRNFRRDHFDEIPDIGPRI